MNVLLSIKHKYFEKIASGHKKYEFRRRIFRKPVDTVYLYCNSSIKGVVGRFCVGEILNGEPSQVWQACGGSGGVSQEDFFDYFENSEIAYAIEIVDFFKFEEPLDLSLITDSGSPPQSFRYLPSFDVAVPKASFYASS